MDKETSKFIYDSLFENNWDKLVLAKSTAYKTIWHLYVDDTSAYICSNVASDIAAWLKTHTIDSNQALVSRVESRTPNCYLDDPEKDLEYTISMKVVNIMDLMDQNDDILRYSSLDTNYPKPGIDRKVCNIVVTNASGVLLCMQKDLVETKLIEEDVEPDMYTIAKYFDILLAKRKMNPVISSYFTRLFISMGVNYTPIMTDKEIIKKLESEIDSQIQKFIEERSIEINGEE